MIEDDFYSTIKLKCGDEIFCKVAPTDEGDRTLLIVHNPITVEEIKIRGKVTGYSFEPYALKQPRMICSSSTWKMFLL